MEEAKTKSPEEVSNILAKATDTVLEKTVSFDVTILPRSKVHAIMQRWKLMPAKRSFVIRPIVMGSMIRISRILLDINLKKEETTSAMEFSYATVAEHADSLAKVCAIAVQNRQSEPSRSLVRLLRDNLSANEILTLLSIVIRQMEITSFMTSIISIRGMNVLPVPTASANSAEENEVSL